MRIARLVPILAVLLFVPACGKKTDGTPTGENAAGGTVSGGAAAATSVAGELGKLLAGITDVKTAEQAKPQLDAMTKQLDSGLAKLKSAATAKGGDTASGTDLTKVATDLAGKAAGMFSPELKNALSGITTEIDRLMKDPAIQGVIGAGLEKLKGLVNIG